MTSILRNALELLTATRSVSGAEGLLAEQLAEFTRENGLLATTTYIAPGRPNVIIEWSRGSGPTLLFSAHLDMLKPPSQRPWAPFLQDGNFFGEGVNNMKAALAAMIAASVDIRDTTAVSGRVVILAAMGEIDTLGRGTVAALDSGLRADAAINGEPTDLRVLLRHAGVARFVIAIRGRSAHVTQREQGHNAIPALAQALSSLDESVFTEPGSPEFEDIPMLNIGIIRGGRASSMLAERAIAEVDVRWSPGMSTATIRRDIARHCHDVIGEDFGLSVTQVGRPKFYSPPPLDNAAGSQIVQAVVSAHREVVGSMPLVGSWSPIVRYGSDAPHLVTAGIPTCVYGPGRAMDINAVQERIPFGDVTTAAAVYARAGAHVLDAMAA